MSPLETKTLDVNTKLMTHEECWNMRGGVGPCELDWTTHGPVMRQHKI
jgi:hypothetical protein